MREENSTWNSSIKNAVKFTWDTDNIGRFTVDWKLYHLWDSSSILVISTYLMVANNQHYISFLAPQCHIYYFTAVNELKAFLMFHCIILTLQNRAHHLETTKIWLVMFYFKMMHRQISYEFQFQLCCQKSFYRDTSKNIINRDTQRFQNLIPLHYLQTISWRFLLNHRDKDSFDDWGNIFMNQNQISEFNSSALFTDGFMKISPQS